MKPTLAFVLVLACVCCASDARVHQNGPAACGTNSEDSVSDSIKNADPDKPDHNAEANDEDEVTRSLLKSLGFSARTMISVEYPAWLFHCLVQRRSLLPAGEREVHWQISNTGWDSRLSLPRELFSQLFALQTVSSSNDYFNESKTGWTWRTKDIGELVATPFLAPVSSWIQEKTTDGNDPSIYPPHTDRATWVFWPESLGGCPIRVLYSPGPNGFVASGAWREGHDVLRSQDQTLPISFNFQLERTFRRIAALIGMCWWRVGPYVGVTPSPDCSTILLIHPGCKIGVDRMVLTARSVTSEVVEFDVSGASLTD